MFGNQVKMWFEINSRRIDKDAIQDIKKQFKDVLGLTNKADPYSGKKLDEVYLMYCVYDSVDEDSDFGCRKDFQNCQANINVSQLLREKVLKKLIPYADFLFTIQEKYGYKFSYNTFVAVQQDLDSECDNEKPIDFSLDNDIIEFLHKIKGFNTLLVEQYHSED